MTKALIEERIYFGRTIPEASESSMAGQRDSK